jgi:APA family basic amino acid/polyamine antiporter
MKTGGELARRLSQFDATCVVIGAIIGVGIFFSPGQIARTAGSSSIALATWGAGAFAALCGALCFARIGRNYPRAGGQYEILRDANGPFTGFLCTVINATAIIPGSAAVIAIICARNLVTLVAGREASAMEEAWLAQALIAGVVLANCVGVRSGASLQNFSVIVKLALLVAIVGGAFWMLTQAAPLSPVATQEATRPAIRGGVLGAVMAGLIPAFFAYGGWQQVLWMAGEVRDAERRVPRAILMGMAVVVAVYLLANWAYFALLGFDGVVGAKALAAESMQRVAGDFGARLVAAGVCISALGVLNAQFLSGPRLLYATARDGRFFSLFARIAPRAQTPVTSILALGVISALLLLLAGEDGIERLTAWVVIPDAVFMILTALALPILERRRGVSTGMGMLTATLVFVLVECAALVGAALNESVHAAALAGFVWMGCMALLWCFFFRRKTAN